MTKIIKSIFFVVLFVVGMQTNNTFAQEIYSTQPLILYQNCQQKIVIPSNEELKVSVSEGKIEKTKEPNIFLLTTAKNVAEITLTMETKANVVTKKMLKVLPFPIVNVYVGDETGFKYRMKEPFPVDKDQVFHIYPVGNEAHSDLAKYIPNDLACKVRNFKFSQFRGGRQIASADLAGNTFKMEKSLLPKGIEEGDGIQLEILSLTRTNYAGEEEIIIPQHSILHGFYIRQN